MNVDEVFAKVIGRQASEQERERLYRLREALGLRDNDAFWSIVMASGSTYSTTTTAALLGLTMAHPTTDAWPSTVTSQVDMDQDGKPGVTRDVPTGTQSNGVTYSGVEATTNFRGSAIMGDAGTTVGIPRFSRGECGTSDRATRGWFPAQVRDRFQRERHAQRRSRGAEGVTPSGDAEVWRVNGASCEKPGCSGHDNPHDAHRIYPATAPSAARFRLREGALQCRLAPGASERRISSSAIEERRSGGGGASGFAGAGVSLRDRARVLKQPLRVLRPAR